MDEISCLNCGSPNAANAKFCKKCGQPLAQQMVAAAPEDWILCPQCNTSNSKDAKFCRKCGNNLAEPMQSNSKPLKEPVLSLAPSTDDQGIKTVKEDKTTDTKLKLVVRWMGGRIQKYDVTKPTLRVGRSHKNDIVVVHPSVSHEHLELTIGPKDYFVTDLDSMNGTRVNGRRIPSNTPHPLNMGDIIRIGDPNGNWVCLSLLIEGTKVMRQLALGPYDLSKQTNMVIGRDPQSYLVLNHPNVSYHHALIMKQGNDLVIRDLRSTNGTFVNGQRIKSALLKSGDVIQIGPFRLTYDPQQKSLKPSMNLGHRIDTINLGREVGKKRSILQGINMTINPGEFVAFVGGSGAGKSTLLKAMNGYEPANHGQILLDGKPLYRLLDLYRTQMGYVPQDDIIHKELPVHSALWYEAKLRLPDARPAEIETRIREVLRAVDMLEHANKPVRLLSGGQRKRVSIAVELLAKPTLFFLDEPTTGLDPGLEKKMMYDLKHLADEGRTVIMVTHATGNIKQCDQVAFLSKGHLAYYGPPDDAYQFYDVQNFSDIYMKLSQEINPALGQPPPPELQTYYRKRYPKGGKAIAGLLWADYYRQSPYFKKYVADRHNLLRDAGVVASFKRKPVKQAHDSILRQTIILALRQFDLIYRDRRSLFLLVLMMPLIGMLFALVSKPYTFIGEVTYTYPEKDTYAEIEAYKIAQLKDKAPGTPQAEVDYYTPVPESKKLANMISLALTQGGTFVAAYEIIKERAIIRRERAVNLRVMAYVLSKVVVLGCFVAFQVLSMLIVLRVLGIDMSMPGAVFKNNTLLELFITLFIGEMASVMFGLFLSAVIPSPDMVIYIVMIQFFMQIILNGATFPSTNPVVSKTLISYWTTVGFGSTIDLPALNDRSMMCKVVEITNPVNGQKSNEVNCTPANGKLLPGGTDANLNGDYQHTAEHLISIWWVMMFHALVWFVLTFVVIARRKRE